MGQKKGCMDTPTDPINILVDIATNQSEMFGIKLYACRRTIQRLLMYNFCKNIYDKVEINHNFHFFYCKLVETLF